MIKLNPHKLSNPDKYSVNTILLLYKICIYKDKYLYTSHLTKMNTIINTLTKWANHRVLDYIEYISTLRAITWELYIYTGHRSIFERLNEIEKKMIDSFYCRHLDLYGPTYVIIDLSKDMISLCEQIKEGCQKKALHYTRAKITVIIEQLIQDKKYLDTFDHVLLKNHEHLRPHLKNGFVPKIYSYEHHHRLKESKKTILEGRAKRDSDILNSEEYREIMAVHLLRKKSKAYKIT